VVWDIPTLRLERETTTAPDAVGSRLAVQAPTNIKRCCD